MHLWGFRTTQSNPHPLPPQPHPLQQKQTAFMPHLQHYLFRTNEKVDFVLHYFKKINFYTVLCFWIEYLILCVVITSASDRSNNFLSGSGVMQDLHYIKTEREKKKSSSLTHAALLKQWKHFETGMIRQWSESEQGIKSKRGSTKISVSTSPF